MKKQLKVFATIFFSLVLALSCLLSACGDNGKQSGEHTHVDDNFDGFCDIDDMPMDSAEAHTHVDTNYDGFCDKCDMPMNGGSVSPGGQQGGASPGDEQGGGNEGGGQQGGTDPGDEQGGGNEGGGQQGDDYDFGDSNYYVPKDGLLSENIVNDKYGTFYEIGVQSFCDSNGDNVGDLQGIISRLPYLRSMGYTGIWLTPIMDGWPKQYNYNIKHYDQIYKPYGTFADFDELVEKAHSLGIKVILDMVFNHTSDSGCDWWDEALQAQVKLDPDNYYYGFYNFSGSKPSGSHWEMRNGYYFECSQYYGGMPDLNLDNKNVRAELAKVIKLWVGDHKIDGMRLDAVKDYYSNIQNTSQKVAKNMEFVNWIVTEAKKYNPDIYVLGEVYSGGDEITSYYRGSQADSYFWFPGAYFPQWSWPDQKGAIGWWVNEAVNSSSQASRAADEYYTSLTSLISGAAGKIPAPFLDAHDTDRIADEWFNHNATKIKFAYGLLSMYTGNTFTYYGDEIAMNGVRPQNAQTDGARRMGFLWDTNDPPKIMVDSVAPNYKNVTGALQQIANESSILRYYQAANNLRNAFPAIIRGTPTKVSNSGGVLTIKKTWNSQTVHIVINFTNASKQVSAPSGTFQKAICPSGTATGSGKSATLPAYSIAVFA